MQRRFSIRTRICRGGWAGTSAGDFMMNALRSFSEIQHNSELHSELQCRICTQQFPTAEALKAHEDDSSSHRRCEFCSAQFRDTSALVEVHSLWCPLNSRATPLNSFLSTLPKHTYRFKSRPILRWSAFSFSACVIKLKMLKTLSTGSNFYDSLAKPHESTPRPSFSGS